MKAPMWLRSLDIIFGLISVILSFVVLVYQELAVLTLIFVLSATLLIVGVARVFSGLFAKYLSDMIRALNVGIGLIAIILGVTAIVYADLTTQLLIYIIAFSMLLIGVARCVIGGFAKTFPTWVRGLLVIIGLMTIGLSVAIFLFSDLGVLTLVILLSFSFMVNGIARIIQGITGTIEEET